MICPKCNTKNAEGVKFCSQCGAALPERDEFDTGEGFKSSTPGTMSGMGTQMASESDGVELKQGDVFAGRYEILNDGFKGGMGVVYKVKDNTLGKIRALKLILPMFLGNEKAISRFKQEVAITQELSHENIVRVYDMGESEGALYFTMEWIDGISMRDYINERKKQNNTLSFDEAKNLIGQICSALSYAHKSIIHRDIKPENILITDPYSKAPKIRITDFGIAKTEAQGGHATTSTYMGTPIYMAPEQYTDASHADKKADIYSAGVILYELLTFMHPLGTFPMPSEVHPSLPKKVDDVIRKALSADRAKRYDDAMDIIKALEALSTQAEPAKKPKPTRGISGDGDNTTDVQSKSKSKLLPVAAGIIILLLAGIGYQLYSHKQKAVSPVVSQAAPHTSPVAQVSQQMVQAKKMKSGESEEKEIVTKSGRSKTVKQTSAETASIPRRETPRPAAPTGPSAETALQDVPLELQVNILGERELSKDDFEEVVIRNGSILRSNDNFQIHLRTTRDCYVYVLLFDSEGEASLLFPGMGGSDNRIKGNRIYHIPGGDNWFYLDEHPGTETVYVVADMKPMTEIGRLLAKMDKEGISRQREDTQALLAQIRTRGVDRVGRGRIMTFRTSDGGVIKNVTEVVKGKGDVVWSVSFKHI